MHTAMMSSAQQEAPVVGFNKNIGRFVFDHRFVHHIFSKTQTVRKNPEHKKTARQATS